MKTITAVPESTTREQYLSLIEPLGFDIKELRRLEFRTDGVYAEVFARNDQGSHFVDQTDEVVVDRVFIPVSDG